VLGGKSNLKRIGKKKSYEKGVQRIGARVILTMICRKKRKKRQQTAVLIGPKEKKAELKFDTIGRTYHGGKG